MENYFRIRRIHTISVSLYWVCTVVVLVESFVLFIKAVTPAGLRFPDQHKDLRGQEIAQFVIAVLQLFCMSMGIVYRVKLSQRHSRKSAWVSAVFILSLVMLGISVDNVTIPRNLVIFLFALVQASAAVCIFLTCHKLRKLVRAFHRKKVVRAEASVL